MKKILLAVCGTTPQIITETLYALWEHGQMPDSIIILTTKAGRDKLHTALLHGEQGYFYKFCEEYGIDSEKIDFSWKNVLVPINHNSDELDDIRTEEDSSLFMKLCLEECFKVTQNPNDTVLFSIAAGRKTMGASLTLGAQYYGRKQDRLYHVLVQSEFEYSTNFYYPPKTPEVIELRNQYGEKFFKSTEYAKVSLTRIPFFSVREKLSKDSLQQAVLPEDILNQIEFASIYPLLRLNIRNCSIEWNGKAISLQPAWFTLYLYFVKRKARAVGENYDSFTADHSDLEDANDEIRALYYEVCRYLPQKEVQTSKSGIISLEVENFNSYKSKINKKLQNFFGTSGCKEIIISPFGKKPDTKYGISLPATRIEIESE